MIIHNYAKFSDIICPMINCFNKKDTWIVILVFLMPALLLLAYLTPINSSFLFWLLYWLIVSELPFLAHNQAHSKISKNKVINRIYGFILGLLSGMPVSTWKITHVHGHHMDTKFKENESNEKIKYIYGYSDKNPSHLKCNNLIKRWHYFDKFDRQIGKQENTLFFIITYAFKTGLIQWFMPLVFAIKHYKGCGKFRKPYYLYVIKESIAIYLIVAGLLVLDFYTTLFFLVFVHFLIHFFSRYLDYLFHTDTQSSKYGFCLNCVNKSFNFFSFNTGYHIAHHFYPRSHWSELPKLHKKIVDESDGEVKSYERKYSFSGLFLLLHKYFEKEYKNG